MKLIEQTVRFTESAAKHKEWKLNPDTDFISSLTEGLTSTYNQYGYYLCPCRESRGNREKDKDVICPCQYAQADIDEYGHCYCALYVSSEFAQSKGEAQSIPERRDPDLIP